MVSKKLHSMEREEENCIILCSRKNKNAIDLKTSLNFEIRYVVGF